MIPVVSENWSLPKFAIFDDFSMFQTSPVQCCNLKNHQKASAKNKELIQLVFNSLHCKTLLKTWTITSLTAQWAVHIICIFKSCRYVHTYVDINK